jgi:hypothetical protein
MSDLGADPKTADAEQNRKYDGLATNMACGVLLSGIAFTVAVVMGGTSIPHALPNGVGFQIEAGLVGIAFCAFAYTTWRYYMEVLTFSTKDTSPVAPPLLFSFLLALGMAARYYPAWLISFGIGACGLAVMSAVVAKGEDSPVADICGQWIMPQALAAIGMLIFGVLRLLVAEGRMQLFFDAACLCLIATVLVICWRQIPTRHHYVRQRLVKNVVDQEST